MKDITGEEDFITPITLLFMFSMLFIGEAMELTKNLEAHGSMILAEPVLCTDSVLETLSRFVWFLIPAAIVFAAIKENDLLLKIAYLFGAASLALTNPLINKLGFKILYFIKILIIFAVIMFLIKYLISKTNQYKQYFKERADNMSASLDAQEDARP